jgi:hypothetical protein
VTRPERRNRSPKFMVLICKDPLPEWQTTVEDNAHQRPLGVAAVDNQFVTVPLLLHRMLRAQPNHLCPKRRIIIVRMTAKQRLPADQYSSPMMV